MLNHQNSFAQVSPGDASVARGSHVDVNIRAPQREAVVLYYRQQGDVLQEETLVLNAEAASFRIRNVDATTRYWVRAPDGAVTDTFRITPADPLLIAAMRVEVVYPAYLGRTPESFDKDVPVLEVPAGTQLRFAGRATRPLRSIALQFEQEHIALETAGTTFTGSWTPRTNSCAMSPR